MMKRYLTMLIALVAIVMGAKAATDYGFKIGETAITSDNYESVSQGEAWYYVPTEKVLYLTDGEIYGYNRNSVIQICYKTILEDLCSRRYFSGNLSFWTSRTIKASSA